MLDKGLENVVITSGLGSMWAHFADLDTWLWQPRPIVYDGDVAIVQRLRTMGYEQIDSERHEARLTALYGQLASVVTLVWPGSTTRRDRWALRQDIERADAVPVALGFTVPDGAPLPELGPDNYRVLPMAVTLPPPQLGERALILHAGKWQLRTISVLGDTGLEHWRQMGTALKELNAPAEWWMYSQELEQAADLAQYQAMREMLRSRLLATRGEEREAVREQLASLERIKKNAEKLRKARERAERDRDAWLAQWQEVQRMAQDLAALYWQAHITATSIPATLDSPAPVLEESDASDTSEPSAPVTALDPERAAEVAILEQIIPQSSAAGMLVYSHAEDRAAREASLAPSNAWEDEDGVPRYKASNNLAVYFLDREHPLSLKEAQAQLVTIREGTVLTMRIAQGLWNLRRHDGQLSKNGSVGIRYDEILEWRGVKKHTHAAYPGSEQRVTDGYRPEDREELARDFSLASHYYIQGERTVYIKNKLQRITTKGHYINVSFVTRKDLWENDHPYGVFYRPGDWINDYTDSGNVYLADVDRRIFQLNPQNEQYALKIALYLVERWREQAHDASYDEPITMAELLRLSVIKVDRTNLTTRFAPRIEQEIENLRQRGIIGSYECLTPADSSKARWGKDWLASQWCILPPADLRQNYVNSGVTKTTPALPAPRTGRPRKGTK